METVYFEGSHLGSREVNAILQADPNLLVMGWTGAADKNPEALHVGSVESVENVIGKRTPNFYPEWTKDHWHRAIETKKAFVKLADGYKTVEPIVGEVHISEVVNFVDEWRHYVANGVDLCSWWYLGNETTCDSDPHGPDLPFDIPEGFCGAIDIGRLEDGRIALVEVHHPYAIGWYGEMADSANYLKFLLEGWEYLKR